MLSRRQFVASTAAFAIASRRVLAQGEKAPQVRTAQGILEGSVREGCRVFNGIPFAQPPVGGLRFRAPLPPLRWEGVRDATRCAAAAMQPGQSFAQSEDCLYLNVTAPQQGGPFPVLVWIHGGGFTGGRACDAMADGTHFARNGIVCVNVAYRLGVFGFLDVSPILGAAFEGSANNAVLDLIAALRWVQANIAAFGGDPRRVTIGGQSAGAKLSDLLMGVPSAAPLFQQVISESGGAERIWPQDKSREVGHSFAETWTRETKRSPDAIRDCAASELIAVQKAFYRKPPAHFPLRCEIDGKVFPRSPLDSLRAGSARGKRVLLGTNLDESASFIGPHPQQDPGAGDLGNMGPEAFAAIAAKYGSVGPEDSADRRRVRAATAEEYWIPSLRVAEAAVQGGANAFVYRLELKVGAGRFAGEVPHSYELPFVWDWSTAEPRALAAQIHEAWSSFIAGAPSPSAPGLPEWVPYNARTRPTMLLDTTARLVEKPSEAEFHLWDGTLEH